MKQYTTKLSLLACALFLVFSSFALADEDGLMSSGDPYSSDFYIGVQSEPYTVKDHATYQSGSNINPNNLVRDNDAGLMAGVYTGYGVDFNNGFYLGSELGLDYQPRPPRSIDNTLLFAPYFLHADIIPGFVRYNWLFFARFGVEAAQYELKRYFQNGLLAPYTPDTKRDYGWRAGLGAKDRISSNVSVEAGLTYVHMRRFSIEQVDANGASAGTSTAQPNYLVGNLGLAYHFGNVAQVTPPSLMGDDASDDVFHNNLYAGVQTGLYYINGPLVLFGTHDSNDSVQKPSVGLMAGPYVGAGTDFSNGFYLGAEAGFNYQPKPDSSPWVFYTNGSPNGDLVVYAPRSYYVDLMPGIESNGILFYSRVGLQMAKYHFDVDVPGLPLRSDISDKGFRVGVGLDDQLSEHVSVRAGVTLIQMMKLSPFFIPYSSQGSQFSFKPRYVVGDVGLSYHI